MQILIERVHVQILALTKLKRVDENRDHAKGALSTGQRIDKSKMTRVQSSHRRNKPYDTARLTSLLTGLLQLRPSANDMHVYASGP